ncbi:MAG: leucyl/phenylalanyl-tRNA--protein transferase [Desulfobacteraceae bacterium IS3]|nr:MAG: leucyl/phenylalanyl-tRNA--protein transferase [Desulfobacteraceae bacterium IS3]
MPIFRLSEKLIFPPPQLARRDGLLAVGGDLSEERLLLAYRMGIFPWFSGNEPVLWWSPDPRLVLYPKEIHVSKRLKRTVKQGMFRVTADTAFRDVITSCAQVHSEEDKGTWIVDEMIEAYCRLHESGYAHSAETWYEGELVGGLYGISLGKSFFGESMFSRVSDASKAAFVKLAEYLNVLSFDMIDCQVRTRHLLSFGAREIPRKQFLAQLQKSLLSPTKCGRWEVG